MYQKLRSGGTLSFAVTEQRFEEHQAKWPEAVFNEDAYFKYLQPLVEQNTASYLSMLQRSPLSLCHCERYAKSSAYRLKGRNGGNRISSEDITDRGLRQTALF